MAKVSLYVEVGKKDIYTAIKSKQLHNIYAMRLNFFEDKVVLSQLKSLCLCQVKSSVIKSTTVDLRVILGAS